jgi:hypothetical protein
VAQHVEIAVHEDGRQRDVRVQLFGGEHVVEPRQHLLSHPCAREPRAAQDVGETPPAMRQWLNGLGPELLQQDRGAVVARGVVDVFDERQPCPAHVRSLAEPHNSLGGTEVDLGHDAHLLVAFVDIPLVDAAGMSDRHVTNEKLASNEHMPGEPTEDT